MYSTVHSTYAKRFLRYRMSRVRRCTRPGDRGGLPEAVLILASERPVEVIRVRGQYYRKKKEPRVGELVFPKGSRLYLN